MSVQGSGEAAGGSSGRVPMSARGSGETAGYACDVIVRCVPGGDIADDNAAPAPPLDRSVIPDEPGGKDFPLQQPAGEQRYQITRETTWMEARTPTALPAGVLSVPQPPASKSTSTDAATGLRRSPSSAEIPEIPDIGGLDAELTRVLALAREALHNSSFYTSRGVRPPRGALLVGPPGTGKTLLARAAAAMLGVPLHVISASHILSAVVGESEAALRRAFAAAAADSPCILFLDEVDGMAPARDGAGEVEARVVAQLLTLLDGIAEKPTAVPADSVTAAAPAGRVFVLAATNRASALDPALRRAGRLDEEVAIAVPTQSARLDILRVAFRTMVHSLSDAQLAELASRTHGYVGADLAALCHEAAVAALRRCLAARAPPGLAECAADTTSAIINQADVTAALARVQPSALREIAVEVPCVRWSDIGGQEGVKQQLCEAVEIPLTHPETFHRLGIRPPKGILLYGPPGCSKTMMARAMATESNMNFLAVKGPELFSRYVGDSEKAVAEVFHRARQVAPCIIFFDEFDSMAGARGAGGGDDGGTSVSARVVSQLLTELDGISALKQVVVVAATNRPDLIDKALLRPGRIDRMMYVGPPDAAARCTILGKLVESIPHAGSLVIEEEAAALEGYSGAEIAGIFRDACVRAVAESPDCPVLQPTQLRAATRGMPKQITAEMLRFYATFALRS